MTKLSTALLAALTVFSASSMAFAAPAQVILMRHAEKPIDDNINTLSQLGSDRAAALVDPLKNMTELTKYGPPVAIYAMGPHGDGGSLRPILTMGPYSSAHEKPIHINSDYTKKDVKELVKDVHKNKACDGKTAVVCWEHGFLTEIAKEFGVDSPPEWDKTAFNRAWVIDFDGKNPTLKDIPLHVLPSDKGK